MDSDKAIIIIGAGITGLTAAYHLVKRGFRVKIIEASRHVGGLAGSLLIDQSKNITTSFAGEMMICSISLMSLG
jgi:phytoene dehydrogenase-like protein